MMNGVVNMEKDRDTTKRTRYARKIGRMGNSLGISLPKRLAEKMNVTQGDEIEFFENDQGEIVIKKVWKSNLPEHVRPEVLEAFYDVFHEDKDIFNDLRDR
ncbi:AbrB/MazE/SpoVT family DNA-binding domain-containing protein [Paenibacillus dendritiformis]|uniref:Addiction module antidote n=3 Tax=Paenibacillus TaxID=44249 RepID=H3SKM7_9BACL|nr:MULTISPECIES: AbrB/MazE/SpoVT family DNA-binding domain-containing protein [Paenibacillus]MEB9893458.1 AbrB/MazE/SpoVT family DNA-binding domain-containing protein [Bacillus cereus]EHQ60381.1 addiction module antidote [Paenibacillus dendritiformis C454]MBG9793742.1 addiction module antidote protein [Paenibacillus dendritiformis]PZM67367.1 AbrB/MazE/SpoVT family DNA-binding domain-containing protein [Paenibacillus dendritiformis]WCF08600.1 AbrB/MazE/SpoVT family DNA-binding domain-containing